MALYRQAFIQNLYLEHLEEAAFLYIQRNSLHTDDDVTWLDIGDFENRLEAHIQALVAGDQDSLQVLTHYQENADYSELFVITCFYCRLNKHRLFLSLLQQLDFSDRETVKAVTDALILDANAQWLTELSQLSFIDNPNALIVLLPFFTHRGLKANNKTLQLIEPLLLEHPQLIHCWANTHLPMTPKVLQQLIEYAGSTELEPELRHSASIVLLQHQQLTQLKQKMRTLDKHLINYEALAIATDASLFQFLHGMPAEQLIPSAIKALGIIGIPESIPKLIPLLNNEEKAPVVAEALSTITGAPLHENRFIEETISEDLLFPEELEDFRAGKPPQHIDRPFGLNKQCLSHDPSLWLQWVQRYRMAFTSKKRHRLGILITPLSLVQTIRAAPPTHNLRRITIEELRIRYQCDLPFNVTDRVTQQLKQLDKLTNWANEFTEKTHCQPGSWYLRGIACT